MDEESFVGKFIKGYADAKSGKARLRTETYVSPVKLAERRFYWKAETDEGDVIEIDVPLPKNIIADAFSFLFLAAYNFLFANEVIKNAPLSLDIEKGEALAEKIKDTAAEKLQLKQRGQIYLEYLFYVLWNQDNPAVREILAESSQADSWDNIFKSIPNNRVHSYVTATLAEIGFEYVDALENLIPLALDLYLYVNSLRKPKIRKLDEEGVMERAEGVARWL